MIEKAAKVPVHDTISPYSKWQNMYIYNRSITEKACNKLILIKVLVVRILLMFYILTVITVIKGTI